MIETCNLEERAELGENAIDLRIVERNNNRFFFNIKRLDCSADATEWNDEMLMIFPQLEKSESRKSLTSQQTPREHFGLVWKILVQARAHVDKIQFFASDILSCEALQLWALKQRYRKPLRAKSFAIKKPAYRQLLRADEAAVDNLHMLPL